MELIVVVIIIGLLAMIGLPQFFSVAERGRTTEAATILGSVRQAQLRMYAENSTLSTSSTCADLDVNFTTLKYFNSPDCTGATKGGKLAEMKKSTGANYTMMIYAYGN